MENKSPLLSLMNLGPSMVNHLEQVGITTEAELRKIGPVAAYLRVRDINPKVMNRMALYAIYGALTNQNCIFLPEETKEWLEEELNKHSKKENRA
jgi:DNA transformation protein and related proteins